MDLWAMCKHPCVWQDVFSHARKHLARPNGRGICSELANLELLKCACYVKKENEGSRRGFKS